LWSCRCRKEYLPWSPLDTTGGSGQTATSEVEEPVKHRLERHIEKLNKKANAFTWIFDEREDEREVGKTQDVNEKYLVVGNKVLTLLDTPGHRDLVPVMISGASHCDYGILMVESEKSRFNTGFDFGGQTKEHIKLLNSIGINGLIVVVNKMDQVNWSQEAFDYVKNQLTHFFQVEALSNLGDITFMPVSALSGENIVMPIGDKAKWWKGGPLVDLLSKFCLIRNSHFEH
jgi:translation elongation factor EF-1alpha